MTDATVFSNDWVAASRRIIGDGSRVVLAIVTAARGSVPRGKNTWMLISANNTMGTLGGGEVERTVMACAADLLSHRAPWDRVVQGYQLGPDLGQCCGGAIDVLLEPLDGSSGDWLSRAARDIESDGDGAILFPLGRSDTRPRFVSGAEMRNIDGVAGVHIQLLSDTRPRLVVYGAGHVGQAVCAIGAQLPLRIEIVDHRKEALAGVVVAGNITRMRMEDIVLHVATIRAGSGVLVMTHSHALDYRLCSELLNRDDLAYVGLIGSATKAARFRQRLGRDGLDGDMLGRLTCPIGAHGPDGKEPGVIALSALSEVMSLLRGKNAHLAEERIDHVRA